MVSFPITTAAGLLLLATGASAQAAPTKPEVNPSMLFPTDYFLNYLPTMTNHWVEDWADIHIIEWCKQRTKEFGYNPQDMESFNVHYDDCDPPWIFCRHKNSAVSKQYVIDLWSRVPIGMREHVRHIGVWPTIGTAAGLMGWGGDVAFHQDYYRMNVLLHEVGHAVDNNALRSELGATISTTQMYRDFYNADSHVVTPYSRASWGEHFGELTQYALYDTLEPPGRPSSISSVWPQQYQQVRNQINGMKQLIGNRFVPRSKPKCTFRFNNSPAVLKSDGFRAGPAGDGIPLPDTNIDGKFNVTVMPEPVDKKVHVDTAEKFDT